MLQINAILNAHTKYAEGTLSYKGASMPIWSTHRGLLKQKSPSKTHIQD